MQRLPWYDKNKRSGLLVTLGLISLVLLAAYIRYADGVGSTETIVVLVIVVMLAILAVQFIRWIKGQSIYWWTGHPDTSWEGNRDGEKRGGDVDKLFDR
jgi:hypothetical protein